MFVKSWKSLGLQLRTSEVSLKHSIFNWSSVHYSNQNKLEIFRMEWACYIVNNNYNICIHLFIVWMKYKESKLFITRFTYSQWWYNNNFKSFFLSQVQLLLLTLILVTVLVLHCLIWYSVLGMSLHSYHVNIAVYTATTIIIIIMIIILIIIVMMLVSDVQVCITYNYKVYQKQTVSSS